MAELNLLRYIPGDSDLHRMDPRIKLAGMILLSMTAGLVGTLWDLCWMTTFLSLMVGRSRLSWRYFGGEIRRFAIFVIGAALLQAWGSGFSSEGLAAGLLYAWRLTAVLIIGLVVTGTTRLSELRAGLYWFLQPLPGVPAGRIATMFGLILNLVPLIFEQAALIREAQVARGSEQIRNPLRKVRNYIWPVLRQTVRRADTLVFAMEARCYSEHQATPVFNGAKEDRWWIVLALLVMVAVLWR